MVLLLRRLSTTLSHGAKRWSSTSAGSTPLLMSPKQVKEISNSEQVALLDATWFMPNSPRKARDEYLKKRLPGAQYLDLDEVASPHELGLMHMMPQPHTFAEACEKFGIQPSSHVIIYDTHGIFSSPRALFMFRAFGHEKSSVLNGGLPGWVDEGLTLETSAPQSSKPAQYAEPKLDESVIRSYEQMVSNSCLAAGDRKAELVLDARSHGRFAGTDPEPRPGLSSGHIPNSFSLPFTVFLEKHKSNVDGSEYTTFLPKVALKQALEEAVGREQAQLIIDGKKPVIASCGSGMTAGVIWLGLKLLGVENIALYDESWTGYASRPTSKIEKA